MLRSGQFTSAAEIDYIPVSGVVAEDVVRVQRSGKAIRFRDTFDSGPIDVDCYKFEWTGVDTSITLDPGAYILQVTNSVTTVRTVVYEFGPTVGVGYVYFFGVGSEQVLYVANPLDTAEDVRDGIDAALNSYSWTGFTITTVPFGTDNLRVTFSDTTDFVTKIGRISYKSGYYCTISGEEYLIYYDDDPNAMPTLPGLNAAYNFDELTLMPDGIEVYLSDPYTTPYYVETLEGVAAISGVPGSDTVPDQYCVIDEANQRVYFWENLNIGEVIKIVQK